MILQPGKHQSFSATRIKRLSNETEDKMENGRLLPSRPFTAVAIVKSKRDHGHLSSETRRETHCMLQGQDGQLRHSGRLRAWGQASSLLAVLIPACRESLCSVGGL